MATIHKKVWREYFDKIISGKKRLELRLADFEVNEGDTLVLEEWDKDKKEYTGRKTEVVVTYILKTKGQTFWSPEEVEKYGFQIIQFNPKEKLFCYKKMNLKILFRKFKENSKTKEDLYIKVLLWAHDKQESGFTWDEMKNNFRLDDSQEHWIRKIFLTTSDSDHKFFEHLRNDDSVTPNVHYYSLNEKGITAAINYKGLEHAEKNSERALWFAGLSIFLTAIGLFFAMKQTNLTEIQSTSERINQARSIQSAIEFCKQNPGAQDSGLYEISSGKSAPCGQVIRNYSGERSLWDNIRSRF